MFMDWKNQYSENEYTTQERRMELEESTCLTSGSTTKPQSLKVVFFHVLHFKSMIQSDDFLKDVEFR